jgi:hypothetical protein
MLNFNKQIMKKIKFIFIIYSICSLQSCTSDLDVVSEDPRVLSPEELLLRQKDTNKHLLEYMEILV